MHKGVYWLLESAVEARYPLFWLTLDAQALEAAYNRPSHYMHNTELIDVLYDLVCNGDLTLEQMDQGVSSLLLHPSRDEITAGLRRELDIDYGLTAQGGSRWESIAHPAWDHFIAAGEYIDPATEGEIIAVERTLVEEYYTVTHFSTAIIAGSEQWDVIVPWQATYWKTLSVGHRLRYRYHLHGDVPEKPSWVDAKRAQLQTWYTSPQD